MSNRKTNVEGPIRSRKLRIGRIIRFSAAAAAVLGTAIAVFFAMDGVGSFNSSAQERKAAVSQQIGPEALNQIALIEQDKEQRTSAEQKIDSNLLYKARLSRNESAVAGVPELSSTVATDENGMVDIDITANLSDRFVTFLKKNGAQIIGQFPQYRSVTARVNIDFVATIAERPEVIFIQPKQDAQLNSAADDTTDGDALTPQSISESFFAPRIASENSFDARTARVRDYLTKRIAPSDNVVMVGNATAEGDKTHRAAIARTVANVDGTGLKIGVLSNGVDSLAARQATGDLPAVVTVLPGQASTGDEGTAMLELIHDIAPGAQLYFATGNGGAAQMAQNIHDLRTAGCDIIVDDLSYYTETPFQDGQAGSVVSTTNQGIIVQAVNDVTASGAQYFSSAANSGNKNDLTAGAWEGDFVDGGAGASPIPAGGTVHAFSPGVTMNTETTGNRTLLKWSDPIGGSGNDYDLYILNAAGTAITHSSTNVQIGAQDPVEDAGTASAGERVVIFKKTGAASRYLHLNTNRGVLAVSTNGVVYGHNAGRKTISVAATPSGPVRFSGAAPLGPFPFAHTTANTVELFSSDGPRRIFYNADSSPITPGNVSATGGEVLQKPDITAADGQTTTTPTFIPFFGTSAAAPTAAALMALVKQASPGSTNTQLFNAMTSTALDIEGPGVDRDSGAGIFMPLPTMANLGVTGPAYFEGVPTIAELTGNGNGAVDPGETATLSVPLTNAGLANATAISATISTSTPDVTVLPSATRAYPDMAPAVGTGNSATPFTFQLGQNFPCGGAINFTMTVTYSGGSTQVLNLTVATTAHTTVPTQTLDTTAPANGANYTAATGIQVNRLNRNGSTSACGSAKATPALQEAAPGTNKRYDAFTFTASAAGCIQVTIVPSISTGLFSAAYHDSFDPNAIQTNYLADYGVTTAGTISYGFNVTAGQTFVIVIHEVTTNGGIGATYDLNVNGPVVGGCTPFVPSQPTAHVGGRVLANGQPVANAIVTIDGPNSFSRVTRSSPFGYYSFSDVPTNVQYNIAVSAKRFVFAPVQVTPTVDTDAIDITAAP